MSELHLALAGLEFTISAPADVVALLEQFYPRSLVRTLADSTTEACSRTHLGVSRRGNGWSLQVDRCRVGTFERANWALLALELQIEKKVAAVADGRITIHAGAVETDAGAWLIAGDPDVGKTTTTFQLLQLGQRHLCEEIAVYDPENRSIHPYPQTLTLDRRYLEAFADRFPIAHGQIHTLDESIARFVPDRFCDQPAALERLLLPRCRPGDTAAIEELQPDEVLTEVLGYCFPPATGEERLFDVMIDLLEGTRPLRVTFGDLDQARNLFRDLLPQASL